MASSWWSAPRLCATTMFLWLVFHRGTAWLDVFNGLSVFWTTGALLRPPTQLEFMRFHRHYFANGELIVRHAATGAIWGRCDEFMPVRCGHGAHAKGIIWTRPLLSWRPRFRLATAATMGRSPSLSSIRFLLLRDPKRSCGTSRVLRIDLVRSRPDFSL